MYKSSTNKRTFIEEARRKQILDIALEKITREGFENTTIHEIANQAGISKGVIYYHFKGKHELVREIWKVLFEELFEYRKIRVENQKTATAKLRVYLESNIEFIRANYNKFVTLHKMGIDMGYENSDANHWYGEAFERCFKYLSTILTEGQQKGEFRKFSTDLMAAVIQAAFEGFSTQWIAIPNLVDLEQGKKLLLEMMQTGISKGNK
jgi:AcrR family transcriptional regulator